MSDYIIPEDTGDIEQALKLKPTNEGHADLFNQITQTLINNDNFLKKMANLIYQQAISYTDTKVSSLINGAPETLDTLKEVADAIQANETVVDALNSAIGTKAGKAEFDSHEGNGSIHITPAEKQAIRDNTAQNISFTNSLNNLNTLLGENTWGMENFKYIIQAEIIGWRAAIIETGNWGDFGGSTTVACIPPVGADELYVVKFNNGAMYLVKSKVETQYSIVYQRRLSDTDIMVGPSAPTINDTVGSRAFDDNNNAYTTWKGHPIAISRNAGVKAWYAPLNGFVG